ncbi:phospholipase D-like domain-containing protein [Sphingomonas glaciei]|uniref:Phospholipase D n=1 Tax=Sphingomonas glaciei TaxID=2938948 RepID=A0ABY5MUJ5_9SPHN|nr:phosphatidylserine/phosphatidylglycerophosphate/cardiolipin synthase family protein [Sphingomonas glaciei]UUR07395.1 phosphatidylserine/phosphatidylglycerophosphate/cardiolipin synthase family protein [Sphingomonas glaciei]
MAHPLIDMLALDARASTEEPMSDLLEPPVVSASTVTAEVAGTRLTLVEGGTERLKLILRMIDGATRSVRLLFYMMDADAVGEAVRDALVRAASRGCTVQVILDGFGSSIPSDFFDPLKQAGGSSCLFNPRIGVRYLLRNHQKLVVIDDAEAITGGANLTVDYMSDQSPERWRDLWLHVEGPAVRAAARYYDALHAWTVRKGPKLRELRRLLHRHSQRKGALQWQYTGPVRRGHPWTFGVARDLAAAGSLDMIAAYFSPPFAMLRRLRRLGRRGQVRIMTAARSDNNATIGAARHTYRGLLRAGVRMFEFQPEKLHTKLLIMDDVVHLGSANFDFRSLYLNLEMMLRIEDAGFAAQMRDYFERQVGEAQEITPALHRQRASWWHKLKWALSNFLVTAVDYTVTRRLNFGPER